MYVLIDLPFVSWLSLNQSFIYLHLLILLVSFYSPFGYLYLYYVQYFHGVFKMSSRCSVFSKTSQMCFWVSWCSSCCVDVCAMMCIHYVLSLWSIWMCSDVHTSCSFTMKQTAVQWCARICRHTAFSMKRIDDSAVIIMHASCCFHYEAYGCAYIYRHAAFTIKYTDVCAVMRTYLWTCCFYCEAYGCAVMCVQLQTCCFHCEAYGWQCNDVHTPIDMLLSLWSIWMTVQWSAYTYRHAAFTVKHMDDSAMICIHL